MADSMLAAMQWLEGQRTEHMTRSVTYQRGASSVSVSATVIRYTAEVDRSLGIHEELEIRDYVLNSADLVLGGQVVTPLAGDKIIEVDGTKQFTYEVTAPPGIEPAWRYSDQYRIALRIHTKLTAMGAAP